MATMAVVPSVAIKEIVNTEAISIDIVTSKLWCEQLMLAEMRLRIQIQNFLLFGTSPGELPVFPEYVKEVEGINTAIWKEIIL